MTTAKYTHSDVLLLNVYKAMRSGNAHICNTTVAMTRLLMDSLKKDVNNSMIIPITVDGIERRLDSVVSKPRLRKDKVRYVWGGPTGTVALG